MSKKKQLAYIKNYLSKVTVDESIAKRKQKIIAGIRRVLVKMDYDRCISSMINDYPISISSLFAWSETIEGHEYWSELRNLIRLPDKWSTEQACKEIAEQNKKLSAAC